MKKIFLSIIFILVLSSCAVLQSSSKRDISAPVVTGYNGVSLALVTNAPPSEVFEGQSFEIAFTVDNKGSTDVKNGVYVIGIPSDFETREDIYGRFSVKGKSLLYPFGDAKSFSVSAVARELRQDVERSSISVDVCYPYRTNFNTQVCINPQTNVFSSPQKICTPSAQGFSGQGAPVAVASVDMPIILPHPNPALVVPQFVLHLQNLGNGLVISKQNFADACSQKSNRDIFNMVQVSGSLEDIPLKCIPSVLRIMGSDNIIICTLEDGLEKSRGSHLGVLNINLDYGYSTSKTSQILIKKLAQ